MSEDEERDHAESVVDAMREALGAETAGYFDMVNMLVRERAEAREEGRTYMRNLYGVSGTAYDELVDLRDANKLVQHENNKFSARNLELEAQLAALQAENKRLEVQLEGEFGGVSRNQIFEMGKREGAALCPGCQAEAYGLAPAPQTMQAELTQLREQLFGLHGELGMRTTEDARMLRELRAVNEALRRDLSVYKTQRAEDIAACNRLIAENSSLQEQHAAWMQKGSGELKTLREAAEGLARGWCIRDHSHHLDEETEHIEPFDMRVGRARQDQENADELRALLARGE